MNHALDRQYRNATRYYEAGHYPDGLGPVHDELDSPGYVEECGKPSV